MEIIAEVANAHEGSVDRAISIARSALVAGADAVKFQIYLGDDLLTKDHQDIDISVTRRLLSQSVETCYFQDSEFGKKFTRMFLGLTLAISRLTAGFRD